MRRIRVLVVDDSALMRVLISDMLNEDDDMVIGVARNGEEAVKKALSLHPDVITMDVDRYAEDGRYHRG